MYLQGGPGCPCGPPQSSSITDYVLDKGYQILFIDQRGTGLSTPISAATLALHGDIHRQADYLTLFRADSIVLDLEAVRKSLTADYPKELKKWSVFGQSFGGFCVFSMYFSVSPSNWDIILNCEDVLVKQTPGKYLTAPNSLDQVTLTVNLS